MAAPPWVSSAPGGHRRKAGDLSPIGKNFLVDIVLSCVPRLIVTVA